MSTMTQHDQSIGGRSGHPPRAPQARLAHRATRLLSGSLLLGLTLGALTACSPEGGEGARGDSVHAEQEAHRERDAHAGGHTEGEGATGSAEAHRDDDDHGEEASGRVTLTEAAYRTAAIRVEPARLETAAATAEALEVPAQVEYEPRRMALISSRTPGRIERLLVVEGDRVRGGQTVALLYSPAYVTAQNDLAQAVRRAELLAGTPDEEGAQAIAEAARRRLRRLGVGREEIQRLEAGGEPRSELALTAPFAGSIVEAHILTGAAVEAGQAIFRLADLAVVDVVAEIPERSLPLVSVGQEATISLAAYPTMRFTGRVERLREELNPETRTLRAVIHAPNPTGRLRPGMFATVQLAVPARAVTDGGVGLHAAGDEPAAPSAALVTIPEAAVVTEGEHRFVFVEVGPRTYERRQVTVLSLTPAGSATPATDRVAIRDGVAAGERVVVNGAFTLKSELAKGSLGEHGH